MCKANAYFELYEDLFFFMYMSIAVALSYRQHRRFLIKKQTHNPTTSIITPCYEYKLYSILTVSSFPIHMVHGIKTITKIKKSLRFNSLSIDI